MRSIGARRVLSFVVFACACAHNSSSFAADGAGPVANANEGSLDESEPIGLWLDPRASRQLDGQALVRGVERELGRPVRLETDAGRAALSVRYESAARVQVNYAAPSGEILARSVDLPDDRARSLEVVAWLAGNLARDQAAELLSELRARRSTAAATAPVESETPAAEVAPPKHPEKSAKNGVPVVAEKPRRAEVISRVPPRPLAFDASVWTPVSIVPDSPRRAVFFELALAYADVGALYGFGLSLGGLRTREDAQGMALGLAFVEVGGPLRGFALSPFYVHDAGALSGAQVSAVASVVEGEATGLVIGGAFSLAETVHGLHLGGAVALAGDVDGCNWAGAVVSGKVLNGFQLGGAFSRLRGPSTGVAIGGAWSETARFSGIAIGGAVTRSTDFTGLQLAGALNTGGELRGAAIGTVNVHRKLRGLQLGVINVAEEVEGAAIGLVSIAKNGRVQPVLWTSSDGSAHVAVKSIVHRMYTEFGAGTAFSGDEYTLEGGLGLHLPFGRFFLESGVHYSETEDAKDSAREPLHWDVHYRARAGLRIAGRLDLLAGVGVRQGVVGSTEGEVRPEAMVGLAAF